MLNRKEKALAEMMIAEPKLTLAEYAERLNISAKTCYNYRQKEEFQDYLSDLCRRRFRDMERLAVNKLREEVELNNFKAIAYVLDSLGYEAANTQTVNMTAKLEIDYGDDPK